jgi:hypothetical protein
MLHLIGWEVRWVDGWIDEKRRKLFFFFFFFFFCR